ncbi:hypothetical protein BRDID11018_79520 [Bradyrhizobium diazoefficiens]|jgi:hypothetical protein
MFSLFGKSLRTGALVSLAATVWLTGKSVCTASFAAAFDVVMICAGAGIPTGLMLKSVLMAASWLPRPSQIPTPLNAQPWNTRIEDPVRKRD